MAGCHPADKKLRKVRCLLCRDRIVSLGNFGEHYKAFHEPPVKCTECGREFSASRISTHKMLCRGWRCRMYGHAATARRGTFEFKRHISGQHSCNPALLIVKQLTTCDCPIYMELDPRASLSHLKLITVELSIHTIFQICIALVWGRRRVGEWASPSHCPLRASASRRQENWSDHHLWGRISKLGVVSS